MTTFSADPSAPGPGQRTPPLHGRLPFGVLAEFQRNPLKLYVDAMHRYRDIVRMRFGPRHSYTLFHPELIKYILVDNNRNYIRNRLGNELLKEIIGLNLLTADGDFWLRQRRLMQPAFHRQRILGFGHIIADSVRRLLQGWAERGPGAEVDVARAMMTMTLQVVGRALFSVDLLQDSSGLARSIEVGSAYFAYRIGHLFALPLWVPTRLNREYKASRHAVRHLAPQLVATRRRLIDQEGTADATGHPFDMLDLLLEARYEDTGQPMSDEQLATEIRMFIAAGHETTSNTLTWTLYLLSQHPAVEARLHDELDQALGGREPTVDDLPRLAYTKMVIDEAMRLYPAAWLIARQAVADDNVGDYRVPAGNGVVIPIFAVHRHPDLWDDAERFDPERFAPAQAATHHKFAFLPFGGGPRLCIGYSFALTEAQLVLAMIAQHYRLRLRPGYLVEPEPLITLRVKGGLPMTLHPRGEA